MSGLGNLPGAIGIGKGVFGLTAGPSMYANFRAVQAGAVALEFDEAKRELKRRREKDEEALEAERAAVQSASNLRRDEADLPAVEYETASDAIKDAFFLLRVQVDALVREREFREQAHGDFKMHLDTTKQAVDSAKTEILEGVR